MYLMIIGGQIVSTDDISSIVQLLGETYGVYPFLSLRDYVIQARLPGNANPKPLVAVLNKQYPTTLFLIPSLPPELQNLPANKE
jgi:hypothetical protein